MDRSRPESRHAARPGPAPVLLDVRGLTTVFGTRCGIVRAVDAVSFVVGRGETLALVGESGCGKSVTALSLMRLVQPPGRVVGGEVLLDGRDLMVLSEDEMRRVRGTRIGLVFQEPASALNPVFTIGDQVAEALVVHGRVKRRDAKGAAAASLRDVRLPDPDACARLYPHQLSGGMRQRALIAMAIACRPSLLIADEPTTALDVTIQAEILDLILEMRTRFDLSVLLITHDLGIVAQVADRVAVMYAGRLVEESPAAAIFGAPLHPYTRGLLASAGGRARGRRLPVIDGVVPDLAALPAGCAFAPRCAERLARCDTEAPVALEAGEGRRVRCHLHREHA